MSIAAINWALNVVRGINSTQKAILIALADRANEEHQCWPSYSDICERSCCTRNALAHALKVFEEKGLVSRQQRHNKSTIYTLRLASTQLDTDLTGTELKIDAGTELTTSRGIEFDTLTIKEPSKEPPKGKRSGYQPPEEVDAEVWKDWVEYRKKFKGPTTDRSLAIVANKLKPLSHAEQRRCVDMAIECGWKSVFPKQENNKGEFIR